MSAGLVLVIFLIGVPLYLFFEHPLIFWLILVPIAVIIGIRFILWLKK